MLTLIPDTLQSCYSIIGFSKIYETKTNVDKIWQPLLTQFGNVLEVAEFLPSMPLLEENPDDVTDDVTDDVFISDVNRNSWIAGVEEV